MTDTETNGYVNGESSFPIVHDDSPHRKIEKFLTRAFDGGPVLRVELLQVGTQGDARVGDWNSFEGIGPDHLTMQVLERAMDDARHQKGSPRYVVTFYRNHDERRYSGREWFTLAGGGHEFDGIEEMEGPNGQGLLAQMMRHTEASARLSLLSARDIISDQRREIAEQRGHIRDLMKIHYKLLDTYESLKNQDQDRALTLRKQRFEEVKQEKIFEQIMILMPILMRFLGGDKSDVLRLVAMEQQIRTLFGSMSERQLQEVGAKLTSTQMLSLMDLNKLVASAPASPADAIAEKEKKEKAAEEAEKQAAKKDEKG